MKNCEEKKKHPLNAESDIKTRLWHPRESRNLFKNYEILDTKETEEGGDVDLSLVMPITFFPS